MLDAILTILSFPFWFLAFAFIVTGVFGTVKMNGVPYYGSGRTFVKFIVTLIGLFFGMIAYGMIAIV